MNIHELINIPEVFWNSPYAAPPIGRGLRPLQGGRPTLDTHAGPSSMLAGHAQQRLNIFPISRGGGWSLKQIRQKSGVWEIWTFLAQNHPRVMDFHGIPSSAWPLWWFLRRWQTDRQTDGRTDGRTDAMANPHDLEERYLDTNPFGVW